MRKKTHVHRGDTSPATTAAIARSRLAKPSAVRPIVVRHLPRPNAACAASSRSPVPLRDRRDLIELATGLGEVTDEEPRERRGYQRHPAADRSRPSSARRAAARAPSRSRSASRRRSRAARWRAIPRFGRRRPCPPGEVEIVRLRHRLDGGVRLAAEEGRGREQLEIGTGKLACGRRPGFRERSRASRHRWLPRRIGRARVPPSGHHAPHPRAPRLRSGGSARIVWER